jgi:hypothetical protein
MKLIIGLVLILTVCGCWTIKLDSGEYKQGRLVVCDFDFRKDKQLQAGAREAEAPYRNWQTQIQPSIQEVTTEALPLSWWQQLMNMISRLECRVSLLRVEWANRGPAQEQVP